MTRRFFIAFVLLLFCGAEAAYAAPLEKALKFQQSHYFLGKCELTVARQAFRLDNAGNFKFVVVSKAPDWTVNIYRNDDKIYFSESLAEFTETGLLSDFLVTRKNRSVDPKTHRKSDIDFCGFKIVRMSGARQTLKYMPLERALGASRQIEALCYGLYKMPTSGGIPITFTAIADSNDYFSNTNTRGSLQKFFDTSKIEAVEVPPSFFILPRGYKKAVSVRAVVSGKKAVEQSESALETFTTDDELKKRK